MSTHSVNGRGAPRGWALGDEDVPEPPSPTGQYPDEIWASAPPAAATALADEDVPEPATPTGQYPGDLWAPPSAAQSLGADDDVPEPASPTGQYPDDVWAPPSASASALSADDDVPEPPSATGQYPDDVWGAPSASASALADEAPSASPSPSAPSATPPQPAASTQPSPPALSTPSSPSAPLASPAPSAPAPSAPAPSATPSADAPEHLKEPDYSDELPELPESLAGEPPPALTLQEMYRVVRAVAVSDSGEALYSAVSTDADYAGYEAHYRGRRFGLAFGLLLFTQESGRLGSVLRLAERRSPQAFEDAFGPDWRELLAVTNAETVVGRLSLVAGKPLDDAEWVARFRAAGAREELRNAQNEEAIAHLLRPLVPWAMALGLDTDRGLAFALDRAAAGGLGGGVRWMLEAAGLLHAPAEIDAAVRHLGYRELREFQASTRWLAPTGQPDAATTAGLLARLRRHGGYPLPAAAEVQSRLLAAAEGAARRRLERLSRSEALSDAVFQSR
jgi:hypothetical protein